MACTFSPPAHDTDKFVDLRNGAHVQRAVVTSSTHLAETPPVFFSYDTVNESIILVEGRSTLRLIMPNAPFVVVEPGLWLVSLLFMKSPTRSQRRRVEPCIPQKTWTRLAIEMTFLRQAETLSLYWGNRRG